MVDRQVHAVYLRLRRDDIFGHVFVAYGAILVSSLWTGSMGIWAVRWVRYRICG